LAQSVRRFSLATNAERVCAEITVNQNLKRDDDSNNLIAL